MTQIIGSNLQVVVVVDVVIVSTVKKKGFKKH